MTSYTVFNAIFGTIVLPVSYWLTRGRWHDLRIAMRVAFMMVAIAYPWDFFAVQLKVWIYPVDPGPTLYGVPVNDSVFIWMCTHLTASVLLALHRRQRGS